MSVYTASDDLAVVYVTAEETNAHNMAHGLVEGGLAACVNIVPGMHKRLARQEENLYGYSRAYALQPLPYRD